MTENHPTRDLATLRHVGLCDALEAFPAAHLGKMTVGEFRAIVRLALADCPAYRPIFDAHRLISLSRGGTRLVVARSAPDRSLSGFDLAPEGTAFIGHLLPASQHSPNKWACEAASCNHEQSQRHRANGQSHYTDPHRHRAI